VSSPEKRSSRESRGPRSPPEDTETLPRGPSVASQVVAPRRGESARSSCSLERSPPRSRSLLGLVKSRSARFIGSSPGKWVGNQVFRTAFSNRVEKSDFSNTGRTNEEAQPPHRHSRVSASAAPLQHRCQREPRGIAPASPARAVVGRGRRARPGWRKRQKHMHFHPFASIPRGWRSCAAGLFRHTVRESVLDGARRRPRRRAHPRGFSPVDGGPPSTWPSGEKQPPWQGQSNV
jgi:hypothetical protein